MKKTILSLAVLFASMSGFSAVAQTQSSNSTKATTETQKATDKKKAPRHNPFEGLNLTEKQQSELQALRASKSTEAKKDGRTAGKQDKKQLSQEEKQARQKQHAEQRKARMEQRKQNRQDYLAKVKAILTPEQYVKFLENNYCDRGCKMGKGGKSFAKGKHGKHNGKGKSGHRAHRGNKTLNTNATSTQG